jgi:AcrR family transcriptional regulator
MTRKRFLVTTSGERVSPRGRTDADGAAILDAAAELLLDRGYDRTTLDDVARASGVSRSTIYQRLGGREALFLAVLHHHRDAVRQQVHAEIAGTGGPVDLRHLVAAQVRAHQRRPLVTALLLRDREVLGRLQAAAPRDPQPRDSTVGLLLRLHAAGFLRADRTPAELVAVLSAVFHGYFVTAPLLPAALRPPDAAAPDLVADTAHRALARSTPLDPAEVAALDAAVRDHVRSAAATGGREDPP